MPLHGIWAANVTLALGANNFADTETGAAVSIGHNTAVNLTY